MAIKSSKAKQRPNADQAGQFGLGAEDFLVPTAPFERWLDFELALLKAGESGVIGWLDRRFESGIAALRSAGKLAACRDLDDAMAIQSDWVAGMISRLEHDARMMTESVQLLTQCASGAAQQASETTSSIITRGGEWSVQRAEPEPPKHVEDVGVNDDRPQIVEAL